MKRLFCALFATSLVVALSSGNAFAQSDDANVICPAVMPSNAFLSVGGDLYVSFTDTDPADGGTVSQVKPGGCFFNNAVDMMATACKRFYPDVTPLPIAIPGECADVVRAVTSKHDQEKSDLTAQVKKLKQERRRLQNRIRGLSRR